MNNIIFLISQQSAKNKASYSPGKLERCLVAIEKGEVSKKAASRLYGIPRRTIISKLNGKRPREKRRRGPLPALGECILYTSVHSRNHNFHCIRVIN